MFCGIHLRAILLQDFSWFFLNGTGIIKSCFQKIFQSIMFQSRNFFKTKRIILSLDFRISTEQSDEHNMINENNIPDGYFLVIGERH